jgi:hypothetical protein
MVVSFTKMRLPVHQWIHWPGRGAIQDPVVVVTTVPDHRNAVSALANSMTIFLSGQLFLPAGRFNPLPIIGVCNDCNYNSGGYGKKTVRLAVLSLFSGSSIPFQVMRLRFCPRHPIGNRAGQKA